MTTEPNHPDPDLKKIYTLYGLLGVTLILCVTPMMMAAALTLVFFLLVMLAAYGYRVNAHADSLLYNHATFIIRTIWIGGFIGAVTTIIASIYLLILSGLNMESLVPCFDIVLKLGPTATTMETSEAIRPCIWPFVSANLGAFITSGVIAAAPPMIYFLVRFARGLSRARDGYRISHPLNWF